MSHNKRFLFPLAAVSLAALLALSPGAGGRGPDEPGATPSFASLEALQAALPKPAEGALAVIRAARLTDRPSLAIATRDGWLPIHADPVRGAFRHLAGFEIDFLANTKLVVFGGSASTGSRPHRFVEKTTPTQIDLTQNGLGGLDAGSLQDGWLFVYLAHDPKSGATGFLASRSDHYGGVSRPAGYDYLRQLPLAVYYDAAQASLRSFIPHGWPKPMVLWSGFGHDPRWRVLQAGGGREWTPIELRRFIPTTGRVARLSGVLRWTGGEPVQLRLRTPGLPGTGKLVAVASRDMPEAPVPALDIAANSGAIVQYRLTGGDGAAELYSEGYSMLAGL